MSGSCQAEVELVKQALRAACELEVSSVRESCRSEVESVKESLRQACEAEVRLVREACQSEVQCVKSDLAEVCQVEVAALLSSMQHNVAIARSEQRKQLEVAAEPYMRAVQSAHAQTVQQIALSTQAKEEARRLRALELASLQTSRRLGSLSADMSARELESQLRLDRPFLILNVVRPGGTMASLLGTPPQLEVYPASA